VDRSYRTDEKTIRLFAVAAYGERSFSFQLSADDVRFVKIIRDICPKTAGDFTGLAPDTFCFIPPYTGVTIHGLFLESLFIDPFSP
jgi:hypothetical protein